MRRPFHPAMTVGAWCLVVLFYGTNGRFGEDFNCGVWDGDFKSRNDIDLNVQRVLFTLNWRFGGFGETTAAAY